MEGRDPLHQTCDRTVEPELMFTMARNTHLAPTPQQQIRLMKPEGHARPVWHTSGHGQSPRGYQPLPKRKLFSLADPILRRKET